MTIHPITPLVYAQDMGPAAKVASDTVVRPEAAQAMAKLIAEEMLKEQSEQVQKPEDSQFSSAVQDEDAGGNKQHNPGKRKHHKNDDEPPTPAADPFVGNLINKKI